MKKIIMAFLLFLSAASVAADMDHPETPAKADRLIESQTPVPDKEESKNKINQDLPFTNSDGIPSQSLDTDQSEETEDNIETRFEIPEKPPVTIDSKESEIPQPIQPVASPERLTLEDFVIIRPRSEKGTYIWRVTIKNNNVSSFKKDISIHGSQLSKGKWHPAGKVNISKLKGGQKRVALTNWMPVPEASELKIAIIYKEKDYASLKKTITDLTP